MKNLEVMNMSRLTVLEFGQHIKTTFETIMSSGIGNVTDIILAKYFNTLKEKIDRYDKAMLQIAKSDETAKIMAADKERDNAISAAIRMLSVYELSNLADEQNAFASLTTVFNTYKGIQTWNYEEETSGLDNLLNDLASQKYFQHIMTLRMEPVIRRMATAQQDFKALFSGRMQESTDKEIYDVKAMRAELKMVYEDMINYVLSMAKGTDQELYNKSLSAINTTRKYYADMLARRNTKGAATTTPAQE